LVYCHVSEMLERLLTEQRNPASEGLDRLPTSELLDLINREDQKVAAAVAEQIPQIARAVDAIVERFRRGGRLFYAGAGTSGRLGMLDAAECPPTFGVPPERVQAILAGGIEAFGRSVEASEDDPLAARAELERRNFSGTDALAGISASGRTPYVLGALRYAAEVGAARIALSANPDSEAARLAEIAITPAPGPEVVTGSTRMKAGTAQKMTLNMISTAVMVRMGYVLGNLMVNVQLNSEKLRDRARRIVAEAAGCDPGRAARALAESGNRVRVAIVMAKHGIGPQAAEERLRAAGGHLASALEA